MDIYNASSSEFRLSAHVGCVYVRGWCSLILFLHACMDYFVWNSIPAQLYIGLVKYQFAEGVRISRWLYLQRVSELAG